MRSAKPRLMITVVLALCLLIPALLGIGRALAEETAPNTIFVPMLSNGSSPSVPVDRVIPDRYIIVFREDALISGRASAQGLSTAQMLAEDLAAEYNATIHYTYEATFAGFAATLSVDAVAGLAADPLVAYVEPDQILRISATQSPATWGLDRIDQRSLPLSNAYAYTWDGAGVHAYIIDTGIRATHQEFTGRIGNGYTAINDGRGSSDCNGHGTHVAGTVGGTTYGVAKRSTLHPVRVLDCNGSGTTSGVIAGIDWVTANHVEPAVANMSLGGGVSTTLDNALRRSIAAGITYAVAAGNSNASACNESPARVAEALTVAASTNTDARASFSNYGSCVNLFAPGQSITSATSSSDTSTASYSGTSMASPHVAGAAALYLQANPSASPAAVGSAILAAATTGKLTNIGAGSPNRLLFVDPSTQPPVSTATPTVTPTPTTTSTPGAIATATATRIATATPTTTATPPTGACNDLVVNGGFEAGAAGWTESSARGYKIICDSATCGGELNPHGGSVLAWLGGANRETASVAQNFTLPAGSKATLSYWYNINSEDRCGYDYGYVYVKVGSKTYQAARYSLCSTSATNGWVNANLNLSAYAGKAIRVTFQAKTNNTRISNLFVDDISLLTGSACATGQEIEGIELSEEAMLEAASEDTLSADALPSVNLERRE